LRLENKQYDAADNLTQIQDSADLTTCSAQYDGAGSLKSKHSLAYDSKGDVREYISYDKDNRVKTRTVDEESKISNVTLSKNFDGNGDLMYTVESIWDGHDHVRSIYRDKEGNEIEEPPIETNIAWWAVKSGETKK
jgi:YD repeat-containing protein